MRIEPRLEEVVNGDRGMLRGIQVCLDHECLVSAVSLLFGAIDALSALTRPIGNPDTDREVFKTWVEDYLLPGSALRCSATDLYAARCGVVHTYSADSRLGREGAARPLVYQWRRGPAADEAAPLPAGTIVVEVEALHDAFRGAIEKFLISSETDAHVHERVQHHLPSLLCYTPWPRLSVNFLGSVQFPYS